MGRAVDTIQAFATEAAASAFPTALAPAPGDSLGVRSFNKASKAYLQSVIYSAGGGQKVRVQSPLMHDNVTGMTWQPGEVPANFLLPPETSIELQPVDTISVFGGIAAAGTITAGLVVYYEDLYGCDAQLYRWADIKGLIKYIKVFEVDLAAIAVGAWTDTLFTTTENQLHSDSFYAVLGYDVNPAVDVVGIKGAFTGNLRICGPGPTSTLDITNYYKFMSEALDRPFIPIFNANDRTACYVSAANHAAVGGGAASVYLVCAQLTKHP